MSLKVKASWFKVLCRAKRNLLCIPALTINSKRGLIGYNEIPKSSHVPIIGSFPFFVMAGGQTYLHKYIDKWHQKLGPIFIDKMMGNDLLFISDPDSNMKIYSTEGPFPEHFVPDAWTTYLKDTEKRRGLFFMDGEEWLKCRRILNKIMMKNDSMSNHVQGISSVCKDFMAAWKINPPSNLEYQLYRWNIECVGEIALGTRLGFMDKLLDDKLNINRMQEEEFVKAIYNIFLESANLYIWPAKLAKRLKYWKRFYSAIEIALQHGENYVQSAIQECKTNPNDRVRESILYQLLNTQSVDEETISSLLIDLFLASADTASHAAAWALYLLGRNPQVAQRAREEIFSVLEEEKHLTMGSIKKMPYIDGIIRETLRLYPIAAFLTRKLAKDAELNGFLVPAGTMAITSAYSMGRNPVNFTDPESFKPERWFNKTKRTISMESQKGHVRRAYTPWGLGGRSCIGKRIAELELSLLLLEALKTFEWTVEEEVEMILRMVPVPSKDIKLKLKEI